jgi:hypothetical protein
MQGEQTRELPMPRRTPRFKIGTTFLFVAIIMFFARNRDALRALRNVPQSASVAR